MDAAKKKIAALTCAKLRAQLKKRKLPHTGRKDILVERLFAATKDDREPKRARTR